MHRALTYCKEVLVVHRMMSFHLLLLCYPVSVHSAVTLQLILVQLLQPESPTTVLCLLRSIFALGGFFNLSCKCEYPPGLQICSIQFTISAECMVLPFFFQRQSADAAMKGTMQTHLAGLIQTTVLVYLL